MEVALQLTGEASGAVEAVAETTEELEKLNEVAAEAQDGATKAAQGLGEVEQGAKAAAEAASQMTDSAEEQNAANEALEASSEKVGRALGDVIGKLLTGRSAFDAMARSVPQLGRALFGLSAIITTVGAVLVAGGLAWNSYLYSIKEVETAAAGLGRSIGATAGDLEAVARAGATAGGLSIREARAAEAALLRTGRIGTATMEQLIGMSRNYAATMNVDVARAVDDLGKKFADPKKGLDELQKSLDLLDDKTARYVATLISQNRASETQQIISSALVQRLAAADEGTTRLARAWQAVATAASDAWDWMGRTIDRAIDGPLVNEGNLAAMQARAASLRKMLDEAGGLGGATLGPAVAQMHQELSSVEEWISAAEARIAKVKRDAETDRTNRASVAAGTTARALTPGVADLDALRAQQADLRGALHDPAIAAKVDSIVQIATAYDAVTRAINTYLTPAARAVENDRLAIAALRARTPAEKAAVAEQQKRLELAGQAVSAEEAEAQVRSAGNFARAQATQSIIDQNDAMALNASATLDVAAAYRASAEAAMLAEARRQALSEALLTGANVEVQARLHLREAVAAQAEAGARAVDQIEAMAAAQTRANDAVLAGTMTMAEAQAQAQLEEALRPLLAAQALAEGKAKEELTRIIEALRGAYARLNEEQARTAAADILANQADELEMLRLEASLIGRSAEDRAVLIARMQAQQQMKRDLIDAESDEGRAILANAEAIARKNLEIDRGEQIWRSMGDAAESALTQVGDMLANNKLAAADWGDMLVGILRDVYRELYKLVVTAPLMNALFGTNHATISSAGGLLGDLFGGAFAEGGAAAPNKVILVGENGPELINTGPTGLFVTPLHKPGGSQGQAVSMAQGGSAPIINLNIYEAPGTKAEVTQHADAQGNVSFDVVVKQIEDALGASMAAGRGSLFSATKRRFGLDPAGGLRRSG